MIPSPISTAASGPLIPLRLGFKLGRAMNGVLAVTLTRAGTATASRGTGAAAGMGAAGKALGGSLSNAPAGREGAIGARSLSARFSAASTGAIRFVVAGCAAGSTRTKLIEQGLKDGSIRGEWQIERIPMGRLAEPREIADPVVYLASDKASYITGQTLVVDGGWTVQGMVHIADWLKAPAAQGR